MAWCNEGEIYSFDTFILLIVTHLKKFHQVPIYFAVCRKIQSWQSLKKKMFIHLNKFSLHGTVSKTKLELPGGSSKAVRLTSTCGLPSGSASPGITADSHN